MATISQFKQLRGKKQTQYFVKISKVKYCAGLSLTPQLIKHECVLYQTHKQFACSGVSSFLKDLLYSGEINKWYTSVYPLSPHRFLSQYQMNISQQFKNKSLFKGEFALRLIHLAVTTVKGIGFQLTLSKSQYSKTEDS